MGNKIYDKENLLRLAFDLDLDNIAGSEVDWTEKLIVIPDSMPSQDLRDNDTEREKIFSEMALEASKKGLTKLLDSQIPFQRPDDYFAEMVKSDEHMEKIRNSLVEEAAKIKGKEEAKKRREIRKFGKQIQAQKIQEKHQKKKEILSQVDKFKKRNKDLTGGDDFDVEAVTVSGQGRKARDRKFGFGGKKRFSRKNTSESVNNFTMKKSSKKPVQKRPGKERRKNKQ